MCAGKKQAGAERGRPVYVLCSFGGFVGLFFVVGVAGEVPHGAFAKIRVECSGPGRNSGGDFYDARRT